MHGIGAHEIIIPTPHHGVDLGALDVPAIDRMLAAWVDRIVDLQRDTRFRSFVITHERGAPSDPGHAHAQLLATPVVPHPLHVEWLQARAYHDYRDRCVFCDLIAQERAEEIRILVDGDHFLALCPFAGAAPFEVWITPKRHAARFPALSSAERAELAHLLQRLCARIDRVLGIPPYRLTLHQAPRGEDGNPACHWHIEIVPRLAIAAMAHCDGGLPVNPVAPEDAARLLRTLP